MDGYDYAYARVKDAIDEAVAETDFRATAEILSTNSSISFLLRKRFYNLVREKLEKDPRCFYCEGVEAVAERVWLQHTWAELHAIWAAT